MVLVRAKSGQAQDGWLVDTSANKSATIVLWNERLASELKHAKFTGRL
jgi:hypothetical protein